MSLNWGPRPIFDWFSVDLRWWYYCYFSNFSQNSARKKLLSKNQILSLDGCVYSIDNSFFLDEWIDKSFCRVFALSLIKRIKEFGWFFNAGRTSNGTVLWWMNENPSYMHLFFNRSLLSEEIHDFAHRENNMLLLAVTTSFLICSLLSKWRIHDFAHRKTTPQDFLHKTLNNAQQITWHTISSFLHPPNVKESTWSAMK